ncbi:anti-sigma factor [Nocardioides sp. dk4132]|uniref:anti-sigma factor n=1 Tax=unclassified Nocardioides TaxID=2615069 RepID=UPI001296B0DA|nr:MULTISPECIES: anti-sigma factor [unclassified Nocardioides]MQW76934.1 anti-sigma factor [Nocardioides sp. dk4132]QGA09356.1 anti-sigma factor [Nocardioides sp. dk884]
MSEDIHALSGAYAVDALDDVERAHFERHLAGCEACQAEVDSLRDATALLASTTATPPPPALRDAVLAQIANVRPLPPLVEDDDAAERQEQLGSVALETGPGTGAAGSGEEPAAPGATPITAARSRRRWTSVLAVAAAAVVAGAVGVTVTQPWDDGGSDTPSLSAVEQVRQADDLEAYSQEFPDGSEATVLVSRSLNKAVLETEDMAPAPEGKVYEVWLDHREVGMVSAAIMPEGEDNTVVLSGDPATAIGAGITVEPEGGSQTPSDEVVALFEFDKA